MLSIVLISTVTATAQAVQLISMNDHEAYIEVQMCYKLCGANMAKTTCLCQIWCQEHESSIYITRRLRNSSEIPQVCVKGGNSSLTFFQQVFLLGHEESFMSFFYSSEG